MNPTLSNSDPLLPTLKLDSWGFRNSEVVMVPLPQPPGFFLFSNLSVAQHNFTSVRHTFCTYVHYKALVCVVSKLQKIGPENSAAFNSLKSHTLLVPTQSLFLYIH